MLQAVDARPRGAAEAVGTGLHEHLTCRLGKDQYGIDIITVQEIYRDLVDGRRRGIERLGGGATAIRVVGSP